MITVTLDESVPQLLLGVVVSSGVRIGPASAELQAHCAEVAERVRQEGPAGGEPRREAIRALLRVGGFKPAGRSKPAQEYLHRTLQTDGGLPAILNVVDLLNAVSLASGLPISVLSRRSLGAEVLIRCGHAGERYVFNRSGQELDVSGLICVCSRSGEASRPLGSPVKDSLAGKVTEADTDIAAFVYASRTALSRDELQRWTNELGQGFVRWCGAASWESQLLP